MASWPLSQLVPLVAQYCVGASPDLAVLIPGGQARPLSPWGLLFLLKFLMVNVFQIPKEYIECTSVYFKE